MIYKHGNIVNVNLNRCGNLQTNFLMHRYSPLSAQTVDVLLKCILQFKSYSQAKNMKISTATDNYVQYKFSFR